MDEKKLFEKLDIVVKLLAASVIENKSFREQVKLLSEVGLQPSEIANITGRDANTIRVTKTLMKNKK